MSTGPCRHPDNGSHVRVKDFHSNVPSEILMTTNSPSLIDDTYIRKLSHDLRTPLTSVLGFSELLLEDGSIQGESREYLAIVASEAQRLADLLTAFLDRIECPETDLGSCPLAAAPPEQRIAD